MQLQAQADGTWVIQISAPEPVENPYVSLAGDAEFTHAQGETIRRPLFWRGGDRWEARFAPTVAGNWQVTTTLGNHREQASFSADHAPAQALLTMSKGGRNAIRHSGELFSLVADTAWALPFRATLEQTEIYAHDRRAKGFNAALLMVVQPDMRAEGPEDRTQPHGFARGFDDLPEGRLEQLRPDYFDHLDQQVEILLTHGIVPIYQPLFHGFGWKGLSVAGGVVSEPDFRRFARYLVARYGHRPAIWLPGGDGRGTDGATLAAANEFKATDAYHQPCGIHYCPWFDGADIWDNPDCDFHICQTGHGGAHRPDRVTRMAKRLPVRAVANGEPTYEGMGGGRFGLGTWQSEEAWLNLMAGGTFGVFYGAASLWQWKHDAEDNDWDAWCAGPLGWREALDLEGSRYPGVVGQLVAKLESPDFAPDIRVAMAEHAVTAPSGRSLIYAPQGGSVRARPEFDQFRWTAFDALTGAELASGSADLSEPGADTWMGAEIRVDHSGPLAVLVAPV